MHLIGSLDPGGAEWRMLEILTCRDLTDERHVFVTLSGRKGSLAPLFEALGCEVIPRPLSISFPLWFRALLKQREPTHVHSHVQLASGFFLAIAWSCRVGHRIAHFHSTADGRPDTLLRGAYRMLGRALVRTFATDVISVSFAVAEAHRWSSVEGSKFRVSYLQLDPKRFPVQRRPRQHSARMIAVGRLDSDKNPERAVAIASRLTRRVEGAAVVTLTIVGRSTNEEAERLAAQIAGCKMQHLIHLVGESEDIPALLSDHDLLISTSRREGLPGAIVEAAAAGLPAVVSAIPPNEEVARWLKAVVAIPLDADDDAWCDVIMDVLAAGDGRFDPTTIRSNFVASPFAFGSQPRRDELWD